MKTTITTLTVAIMMMFGLNTNATQSEKMFLLMDGKVLDPYGTVAQAVVRVFKANEVIFSTTTNKRGNFELDLELGAEYMIEIVKEGYLPKRVLVKTQNNTASEKFGFDIELLPVEVVKYVDWSILDFPSAIVYKDDNSKEYSYDQEYFKAVQSDMHALLQEAKYYEEKYSENSETMAKK